MWSRTVAVVMVACTASSVSGAALTDTCNIGFCTLNGGTSGGSSGGTTTVTTLQQLKDAAGASGARIVLIDADISGSDSVRVRSDKTIIGAAGTSLTGIGFRVEGNDNVILRNLVIKKVKAADGDAITIKYASHVWIDHCDLSSDRDNGKDYYDGLIDITRAGDYVTVSYTKLHEHYKGSLVGHSDSNEDEDSGHLRVTYAYNHWKNINSRGPSVRFGTGHVVNSFYEDCGGAVNTRMGARILIESTTFEDCGSTVIESSSSNTPGTATTNDVDLGGSNNEAGSGSLSASNLGYSTISRVGSGSVKNAVVGVAGATLDFGGGGGGSTVSEGTFKFVARHSGLVLGVAGAATENGANVEQQTSTGATSQQWVVTDIGSGYYTIENVNSGRALDVAALSTANGANVQQWGYASQANQEWSFTSVSGGYVTIINRNSGKALDVAAASSSSGANVLQYQVNSGTNQHWLLQ